MARIDTTEELVLLAVLDRLRTELSLDDAQCFLTLAPNMLPPGPGGTGVVRVAKTFYTVAPSQTLYHPDEQVFPNVTAVFTVAVTIWTPIKLDSPTQHPYLLFDATRGLYPLMRAVNRLLMGHDLVVSGTDVALRGLMAATSTTQPDYDPNLGLGFITTAYDCTYDLSES